MNRSDSQKALEVMAENLSVYKSISTLLAPFSSNKNVVIRANIASIVDSVIVRCVFNAFLVSSLIGWMHVALLGNLSHTPTFILG